MREPLKSFRDLIAWQRAMSLVDAVFEVTASLPVHKVSLKSQMERAAVSIAANIAEGYGRSGIREYLQFLGIAAGSLRELETYLVIARRRRLAPDEKVSRALELADEAGRVLFGLQKSLKAKVRGRGSA